MRTARRKAGRSVPYADRSPAGSFTGALGPAVSRSRASLPNNHWLDILIFAFHDGELSCVGTVTAATCTNLRLPGWMIGQSRNIRLPPDPIGNGGASERTETIRISPGQFIEWRPEGRLATSTVPVDGASLKGASHVLLGASPRAGPPTRP